MGIADALYALANTTKPFAGIVIAMYVETPARNHEQHFHAYYGEHAGVFGIRDGELLAGALPNAQRRLVEAWQRARRLVSRGTENSK